MKKLISILLVTVLLIGCLTMAASATATGTISGAHKETTAGSTVTVEFTISELTFQDYALYLDYDSNLTLTAVEAGAASHGGFGANLSTGKIAIYDYQEVSASGVLFVATFEVPSDAAVGTVYNVSVKGVNFINQADETLDVAVNAGSITIICEHSYDEGVVTTEPDCENPGVKTYTCTKCGHTYTETLEALGHEIPDAWEYDTDAHWHTCGRCGKKVDHAAHTLEDHKTDKGQTYQKCTVCPYETDPKGPTIDDVPETGDKTMVVTMTALVIIAMTCAVIFTVKRKIAR